MSEQRFQGTLASGGTFLADGQGLRILDPAGNALASFGSDVISGISRDGQVVTVERHNDTIVTLTTASITDAVGLEQFVRDTIVAPPAATPEPPTAPAPPPPAPAPPASVQPPPEPAPPLAFDAIDEDAPAEPPPAPPPPPAAPRPQIISRPDADDDDAVTAPSPHDLPEPVPTTPPPPPAPETPHPLPDAQDPDSEPVAPLPPSQPPPASYEPIVPPPAAPPPVDAAPVEEKGGRRIWLWGCLGCGGLIIAAIVCVAVLLATEAIDLDELSGDDETPTPFIITATPDDSEPTPEGALSAGESGTLGGLTITYLSSRADESGPVPPGEGNEYLILRFRVQNTNVEAAAVSTLFQFELQDDAGTSFTIGLFANIEESLDTEVPAGETIEGEVAFVVPDGGGPYVASYTDLRTDEPLFWVVS